jgi:asparagine synthetase B (glutamine-hydrolysing)
LRQSISRHLDDQVAVFKDEFSYFVKVDIEAFGEPGFLVEPNGTLSLLTGEPLLVRDDEASWHGRQQDLKLIHEDYVHGGSGQLHQAVGTFSMVNYQPAARALSLIADKVGVRPLYYWADEDYFVFASALRILEGLPLVSKEMDVVAVSEIVTLGAPLRGRTPYSTISALKSAEIIQVIHGEISSRYYWRWDEIQTPTTSEQEDLRRVYSRFLNSVTRRIRDDQSTVAYLSGGLDSRCVTAALVDRRVRVLTFNFARPGTQDYFFGNSFAQQIGTIHQSIPKDAGDYLPDYSLMLARALGTNHSRENATRPSLVWSGEGGSVLLGHVHMNQAIVDFMRADKRDQAIEEFCRCESVHLSSKLLRPKISGTLLDAIKEDIRSELKETHSVDPARNFYLFLLRNDQRRKLASQFENIDVHRLEFQLPFFDSEFLAAIYSVPIERCLYHRFYTELLALFPRVVTSVPWQVYPGHEPCPLPIPAGLTYQWSGDRGGKTGGLKRRLIKKEAAKLLRARDFPHKIISKRNLRLAAWIHSMGWRDYEHVVKAANIYHTYWRVCSTS